ncbi:unnamed protein product [Schistosoma rodhaini]|nr:unnamed protein product [Schistosoma rodhaini]
MSGVRQRKAKTLQDDNSSAHQGLKYARSECSEYSTSDKFVDRPYSLFWLCSVIVIFLACFIIWDDSSDCWSCSDSSCNSFDVVSVRSHLINVTNIGSRTAGSIANEVAAADYLRNELKLIESVSNKTVLVVSLDEHRSSYSSFRALSHVSSYNNVRNFALRFHDLRAKGGNDSKLAFLINCHYDTAPGSPGASDAFVNCAVMLEVCRILATGSLILFNDLIFLFNGAEESMLLSSHAFITQHKWATDIVAFMNLEGAGAAKRLFLFQSGPGPSSDVLLEAYANSFKQPLASVLGEDLFQFGLVLSDTDYRIFRDYGLVPGLDLAYIQDGYVYHTPYDTESRISDRCLRLLGCNILSFVQLIAKDERIQGFIKLTPINHTETLLRVSASGSPLGRNSVPPLVTRSATVRNVYFDLFGTFVIIVPWGVWKTVNHLLFLFLCFLIFRARRLVYVRWCRFVAALLVQVITTLLGFVFSVVLGLLYHHYGCRMVWYSNHYNIVGMFVLPVIWWFVWSQTYLFKIPEGSVFKFLGISNRFSRIWQHNALDYFYSLETDFFDSSVFLIALQSFLLSSINAPSSYVYTFWVVFGLIFKMSDIRKASSIKLKLCQTVRFVSFIAIVSIHTYNLNLFLNFMIPIMGRSGNSIKPDLFLSCCIFIIMLPVMLPSLGRLQCTSRTGSKYLSLMLLNACLSYTILIHASNYGFPYSIQPSPNFSDPLVSPRYLRHIPDSPEITEEESHILIVPIDANGIRYLTPNSYPMSALRLFMNSNEHNQSKFKGIKELVDAEPAVCNYSQPYCGVASVYPFLHIIRYFYRVPAEFHKIEPNVNLKLLSRKLLMNYLPNGRLSWNFTFSVVSGPPHTHILIRTDGNYTKLTAWSFASTAMYPSSMPLPPPLISDIPSNKGEHYFLYHLNAAAFGEHGVLWETPWTFWVVFESQEVLSQSSYIDVAIAGLYVDEGVSTRSPPLSDFLSRLPPWVTVTWGCAVYDHWRFHLN